MGFLSAGTSAAVKIAKGDSLRVTGIADVYKLSYQQERINGYGVFGPYETDASLTIAAVSDVKYVVGDDFSDPIFIRSEGKTIGVLNEDGTAATLLKHKKYLSAATVNTTGLTTVSTGTYTFHQTFRAPAHFDAVQITVRGDTSSANTYKVSVAPSASFNNGWQPVDGAGTNVAFVPVTFGTTDRRNPRNPGGGAATTVVSGTSGTNAAFNLIEGDAPSDILKLSSLPRTDQPGSPPLLMVRLFGVNPPSVRVLESTAVHPNAWINSGYMPDHFCGFWGTTDYTVSGVSTNLPGVAPSVEYMPSVMVTFYLRGEKVNVIGVAGDSIEQGFVGSSAVPQFGGNISGYLRRMTKALNDSGRTSSFVNLAQGGDKSSQFLERAISMALRGGLTHLFFKPWSWNSRGDGMAAVIDGIQKTTALISLCRERNIIPVVIQPWGGQNASDPAIRTAVDLFIQQLREGGVNVFDPRHITDNPNGTLKDAAQTVNSGGAFFDGLHINDAYHQLLADYALSLFDSWE